MFKLVYISLLIVLTGIPSPAGASPSVGVGTGKLTIENPALPGNVITLPQFAVYNDGSTAGSFFIEVTNNENQPQHKISSKNLIFTPQKFELGPGESQLVSIQLSVPVGSKAGEYFGYIEAGARSDAGGVSRVSAVSAAKLTFTVQGGSVPESAVDPRNISNPGLPVKNAGLNQLFATSPIL